MCGSRVCWIHVVSVGTSVLRNLARDATRFGWCREVLEGREIALTKGMVDEVVKALLANPRELSAELNAMYDYIESGDVDEVYLLSTDTYEGELAAKLLKEFFDSKGIDAYVIKVKYLGMDFDEGLLHLIDEVAKVVKEARGKGCKVALNLTGGFKPESAFLYLAACLLGINKVYYIHEVKTISKVELPVLEVTIPTEYVKLLKEIEGVTSYIELVKRVGLKADELREKGLLTNDYRLREFIKLLIKGLK